MTIYCVGNLSVQQIEERTGITLSDADREYMIAHRQEDVHNKAVEEGKWHCYDMPFLLLTHDEKTADTYGDMLMKYDWANCREDLLIGREEE